MRAVVQRVKRAEVRVEGKVVGSIGTGLLILVAIAADDTEEEGKSLAAKIVNLRVFDNESGKMDRSLAECGGAILCVSEFTLYGDCRRGKRPSYTEAASPEVARVLYEGVVNALRAQAAAHGFKLETGQFQAMMEVEAVNDGPVTLLLDTRRVF